MEASFLSPQTSNPPNQYQAFLTDSFEPNNSLDQQYWADAHNLKSQFSDNLYQEPVMSKNPSAAHRNKSVSTSRGSHNANFYSLEASAESTSSLVPFDAGDDHVLEILHSENLQYNDVEALVVNLNPQRAQDILMSYRILSTLTQYMDETESWKFCLLNNYDFQNAVRQFDLDVAIVVGKRAEHLLAEIYAWNIPRLKRMVTSFSAYYTDEATILTMIVFRIMSKYSDLEFTLQLALSRATLIKIHYEMAGLFSKLPGGSESTSSTDAGSTSRNNDLVAAYRKFVSQLLEEIETTPFESVQQELFQIVHDLRSMFSKFSDSRMLKSLESDSPSRDETFFDLSASTPSLSQSASGRLPPLAEEWQGSSSGNTSKDHKRTMSSSTSFSNATAASIRSTLSEELPAIMHAFEIARNREEYSKQQKQASSQQQHLSVPSLSGQTTPPETPVRASRTSSSDLFKSPTDTSMSSSSIFSSPLSTTSTNTMKSQQWPTPNAVPPKPASILSSSAAVVKAELPSKAMEVKMISNRMMIEVDGKFIDMQDWAERVNSVPPPSSSSSTTSPSIHSPIPLPTPPHPSTPAGGSTSGYGLGTLFQPWIRPAAKAVTPPLRVAEDEPEQQLIRRESTPTKQMVKAAKLAKPQSIDDILATSNYQQQQQQQQPASLQPAMQSKTLDMLRAPAMPKKPSVATTLGPSPPPTSSATAALNSSSWIKGVLGKAEDQFGKNYTKAMDF